MLGKRDDLVFFFFFFYIETWTHVVLVNDFLQAVPEELGLDDGAIPPSSAVG